VVTTIFPKQEMSYRMAVIPSVEEEKINNKNNNDNDKRSEEVSQLGELKTSVMKLERRNIQRCFLKLVPN
jgi:hypothetical protein